MGLLAVLALLMLLVLRALPAAARAWRELPKDRDRPARLLALATRSLPRAREDWGRAMLAELGQVRGARARRRFSLGCARASALIRLRATFGTPSEGGAVVLTGVAAAGGLAAYGFIHYPDLRADTGAWVSAAALLALA